MSTNQLELPSLELVHINDLHRLTILVISDIHGDLESVEKIRNWASETHTRFDFCICLGDLENFKVDQQNLAPEVLLKIEASAFLILENLTCLAQSVVMVPGNHDPPLFYSKEKENLPLGVRNIHGEGIRVCEGLIIVGFGGCIPGKINDRVSFPGFPFDSEKKLSDALHSSKLNSIIEYYCKKDGHTHSKKLTPLKEDKTKSDPVKKEKEQTEAEHQQSDSQQNKDKKQSLEIDMIMSLDDDESHNNNKDGLHSEDTKSGHKNKHKSKEIKQESPFPSKLGLSVIPSNEEKARLEIEHRIGANPTLGEVQSGLISGKTQDIKADKKTSHSSHHSDTILFLSHIGPYGAPFSDSAKDRLNIEVMGSHTFTEILTGEEYERFSSHIGLCMHGHAHDSRGYAQRYGIFPPIMNPGASYKGYFATVTLEKRAGIWVVSSVTNHRLERSIRRDRR